ncbi:MAG: hypothetical protein RR936_08090 [Carnobacterium sp.]|uniref:hypothetical protein n=1 Tax=Carnobacterium sp. TaxID=48221 RepID=UPI002FCA0C05
MTFKVIKDFKDLEDGNHIYRVGDFYPRQGKVKKVRAEKLATEKNKIGEPVIEEVKDGEV